MIALHNKVLSIVFFPLVRQQPALATRLTSSNSPLALAYMLLLAPTSTSSTFLNEQSVRENFKGLNNELLLLQAKFSHNLQTLWMCTISLDDNLLFKRIEAVFKKKKINNIIVVLFLAKKSDITNTNDDCLCPSPLSIFCMTEKIPTISSPRHKR